MTELEALRRAVAICGSQSELARRVKKRQSQVWTWINRDKRAPADVCLAISRAVDGQVTVNQLRPDVFGSSEDDLPNAS